MAEARRVGIVTGAASGVGAECARQLAAAGWNVVVNYRQNAAKAQAVAQSCRAVGVEAMTVQGDVSIDADCRRIVQTALDHWSRIDGVVNNAGTTKQVPLNDLEGLSAEDFQNIHAVNTVGPFLMSRAAAQALKEARGSIVNISSRAAWTAIGGSIAYATSKGALNTLTIALAKALAPQVRVNAVCPGLIDTEWLRTSDPDLYAKRVEFYRQRAPLGRVVKTAEVANAALWLLSGATATTGQCIVIDSGMSLG